MLISCGVTVQLIYAFVFAFAKSRFSPNLAHLFKQLFSPDGSVVVSAACDDGLLSLSSSPSVTVLCVDMSPLGWRLSSILCSELLTQEAEYHQGISMLTWA